MLRNVGLIGFLHEIRSADLPANAELELLAPIQESPRRSFAIAGGRVSRNHVTIQRAKRGEGGEKNLIEPIKSHFALLSRVLGTMKFS